MSNWSDTESESRNTSCQLRPSVPNWFYAFIPHKLGSGLTSTLLPLYVVQVIGGSVADVGRVTSLTALAGVPGSILWGNLSDRLGRRRPFLLMGFLGFSLATLLIGLGQSLAAILVLSALGGVLGAAIGPIASAAVLDEASQDQWPERLGRFNQIGGWSFVAGLVTGTIWLSLLPGRWGTAPAMRGLFLLAGGVALLSLIMTVLWLPEPPTVQFRRQFHPILVGRLAVSVVERVLFYPPRMLYFVLRPAFLGEVRGHLKNTLGRYYLCSFLLFLAINVGFVPFPIFLTDVLGASNAQVFLISLIKSTVDALFYVPMGRVMRRRRGIGLQAQAAAVRVGILGLYGLLALVRPGSAGLIVVGLVHTLTGVTWAAIAVSGTTAVAGLAPKELEGRAMGLYNAVIGAAGIAGSLAGGHLAQAFGYGVSFGTGALLMGLAAAWLWQLRAVVVAKDASRAW
jgi:DHA1 family multidrug resistance protein-like MFS transporter